MRKFGNILLIAALTLTVFGCAPKHVEKSVDDIDKIVTDNNMKVEIIPYSINPSIEVSFNQKSISLCENGMGWYRDKSGSEDIEYCYVNKDESDDKASVESFENTLKEYDVTEEELKVYLNQKLQEDIERFNAQSPKEKILEANPSQRDKYEGLLDLDEENIQKIYDYILAENGKLTMDVYEVEEGVTLEYFAPKIVKDSIARLKGIVNDSKYISINFEGIKDVDNHPSLMYSFKHDNCSGFYAFSFDQKNEKLVSAACLIQEFDKDFKADLVLVIPGYLAASIYDIDTYDALSIINNSYNTVYTKGSYSNSLLFGDEDVYYILMNDK